MSGKTVTSKRIKIELDKLEPKICYLYERDFPNNSADEEFWKELAWAEDVLVKRLTPRPLGVMEIRRACSSYTVHFRKACDAGKQRAGITAQNDGTETG